MTTFIYTGTTRGFTDEGSPLLLGEAVELDNDQRKTPGNQALIRDGVLIESDVQLNPDDVVDATDGAKQKALELGVDLTTVTGSGEGGRITQNDVAAAASTKEEE